MSLKKVAEVLKYDLGDLLETLVHDEKYNHIFQIKTSFSEVLVRARYKVSMVFTEPVIEQAAVSSTPGAFSKSRSVVVQVAAPSIAGAFSKSGSVQAIAKSRPSRTRAPLPKPSRTPTAPSSVATPSKRQRL